MLRRGTGGYYVNGVLTRWPRAAISIRDLETYVRAGSVVTPDLTTTELAVRNILIAESAVAFQTGTGQNAFDLTANNIVQDAAVTTALFTAFPATIATTTTAAAFDWTPPAASAAATGGLTTFTGKLATAAGTVTARERAASGAGPGVRSGGRRPRRADPR